MIELDTIIKGRLVWVVLITRPERAWIQCPEEGDSVRLLLVSSRRSMALSRCNVYETELEAWGARRGIIERDLQWVNGEIKILEGQK